MKDSIALLLYQLVYWLIRLRPAEAGQKHLVLIKTDEIGDYMLIRNQLAWFRNAPAYKDHTITLIGNELFKPLFDAYDAGTADRTVWLQKKKFRTDLSYRFTLLKKIRQSGASTVINLIYSRSFRTDDLIAAIIPAPVKIAMKNDQPPASRIERILTPRPLRIYRSLFDTGGPSLFDAYRNARFIGTILGIDIHPIATLLTPAPHRLPDLPLPGSYFVVFPGSGIKTKKWPAAHFAAVAMHITDKYRLIPIVCGSEADRPDCENFLLAWKKIRPDASQRMLIDCTGKTSLLQFLALLKEAACLISVDTGSVHLAAAVQCPVFALFSGLHYGRFAPYPPEIAARFYPVYPDNIDAFIADGSIPDHQDNIPVDLIKKIPAEKLIDKIDESYVLHDRLVHKS